MGLLPGTGPSPGRRWTRAGVSQPAVWQGRGGVWEVLLKPAGRGLRYVGAGQPTSTGRWQGFASSRWPGGTAQGLPG